MLDGVMLMWWILTIPSFLFVTIDIFITTPEATVMKWAFVILTAFTGPVGAFFYVLGCREPIKGTHEQYVSVRWRQVLGSTMHCAAGDGIGIIVGAAIGAAGIPVVATNRGGQVTYHGPGQVVAYPLVDLQRLGIYVKEYVYRLEQAVIQVLDGLGVTGHRVVGAPGIYVRLDDPASHAPLAPPGPGGNPFAGLGKIAALGIKVSRHCAYHGLALNVAMNLEPFRRIDPCGYAGLATVDLRHCGVDVSWDEVATRLSARLQALLQPRP